MSVAGRDANFVPSLLGVSSSDGKTVVPVYVDPSTHRLLVDLSGVGASIQTDTFTSTANQTTFTPTKTPVTTIYMGVNGAIQMPGNDYNLTGGNYVLTSGIPASSSGTNVIIVYTTT